MPSVFQNLETSSASVDTKTPALQSGAVPIGDNGGSITVDATSLPLPTGAATQTTLAAVDTKLGGTLAVSASSLPLPTGAATEAKQDATNTLLSAGTLAVRRDAETTPAVDGGTHPLYTGATGRLKVSAMPAMYDAITGNITANGQSVSADVDRASNVNIYCTGTFAGSNCTFEGSIDGGSNWFGIQAVRTNANTVETTTGVLGAAPAYAWELSVNALTNVRVRATAFTSGTQAWRIQPGAYATEPVPAIQTHAVTGSGNFAVTMAAGVISTLTPGTAAANLGKAEDAAAASGDTGVAVFGVRQPTTPVASTSAAGDYSTVATDAEGKMLTRLGADPANSWQANVAYTTTGDVALIATAGATLRRYITDLVIENTAVSAARCLIKDGATTIATFTIPASTTITHSFTTPIRTAVNAAVNVALGAAGTVTVTASGYNGI